MGRWLWSRPVIVDGTVAVVLAVLWSLVLTHVETAPDQPIPTGAMAVLWSVLGVVPLVLRRWRPWWAVAALIVLAAGSLLNAEVWQTAGISMLFVVNTAASWMPLRPAVVAAGLVLASTVASSFGARPDGTERPSGATILVSAAFGLLLCLVAFVAGVFSRTRRAYLAALEARASEAEANQRVLAEQAVAEERRRIARELHDVVAHHVSAMGVLATGARRALDRDPSATGDALRSIEQTGRIALREMRRLLSVLRAGGEDTPESELVPAPGLTAVRGLIEQVRRTGLPVSVQVEGEPYPVDAGIGLTVYRLIQEALTNSAKHAGPAEVQVRLEFSSSALSVEVFDTGRGPSSRSPVTGHGLVGMRERVALYGGELRTGPRPGGGFRVYATIPMDNLEGLSPTAAAIGHDELSPSTTEAPTQTGG
jgi:signal transduction histidine kinase